MGFFRNLLNQLLPNSALNEKSDHAEVLLQEEIKFDDNFENCYEAWRAEENQQGIIIQLFRSAQLKNENPAAEVNYFAHRSEQANGFYFHGEGMWSVDDYRFFVHYLIVFLKEQDYRLESSKRKVIEDSDKLLTIERFYLKPRLKFRLEKPIQQLYGNIIIEHHIVNESTNYIKLMAQVYQGYSYEQPKDFDDLMHKLFVS